MTQVIMNIFKMIQLKPDERVIAIHRHYGWTYAGAVALAFILIVLPFFLLTPLFSRGIIGTIIFVVLLVIAVWYGLRQALLWHFNIFVVTDRRVVDIEQRGYFDRTVSEVMYPKIQDVSYRIKGIFPTLCHYGAVTIQTIGNAANLELTRIKNHEQLVDLLNELRQSSVPSHF